MLCRPRSTNGWHHAAIVNRIALKVSGIDGTERLTGSAGVAVDVDGVSTGMLNEMEAIGLVRLPAPSVAQRKRSLRALLTAMAATGLTSTHSLTYDDGCRELLEALDTEAPLPLRVRRSPVCDEHTGNEGVERVIALQGVGGADWMVEAPR